MQGEVHSTLICKALWKALVFVINREGLVLYFKIGKIITPFKIPVQEKVQ